MQTLLAFITGTATPKQASRCKQFTYIFSQITVHGNNTNAIHTHRSRDSEPESIFVYKIERQDKLNWHHISQTSKTACSHVYVRLRLVTATAANRRYLLYKLLIVIILKPKSTYVRKNICLNSYILVCVFSKYLCECRKSS